MGLRPEAGMWASGQEVTPSPRRIMSDGLRADEPACPISRLLSVVRQGLHRARATSALACHQGVHSDAVGWTHKTPEAHRHPASPDVGSMFHVKFSPLSCVCSAN